MLQIYVSHFRTAMASVYAKVYALDGLLHLVYATCARKPEFPKSQPSPTPATVGVRV